MGDGEQVEGSNGEEVDEERRDTVGRTESWLARFRKVQQVGADAAAANSVKPEDVPSIVAEVLSDASEDDLVEVEAFVDASKHLGRASGQ